MFRGKNYKNAIKLVDKTKTYSPLDAFKALCDMPKAKFDETVELHVKLGVDGRQADQQVRGVVVLPEGTGKTIRVLVIAKGDKADAATAAGADIVGAEEIINKIAAGWIDFDVCVTTPDMMGAMGKVARILGPKGLMPNPKSGTVATDVAKAIKDIKAGKVEYRLDKNNIVHVVLGKVSFGADRLTANFNAMIEAIIKAKPASSKGIYLKSIYTSSTMSPSIKINYV